MGLGTKIVKLGIAELLKERSVHQILAQVKESNTPSQKVFERLGFQKSYDNSTDMYFYYINVYDIANIKI
jgi:RimJ/RimL family protein N-acetyltransferase